MRWQVARAELVAEKARDAAADQARLAAAAIREAEAAEAAVKYLQQQLESCRYVCVCVCVCVCE